MSFFSALTGGGVVASLCFLLMRGMLSTLKQQNGLITNYESRHNNLVHENGTLNALIDDQRKTIIEAQVHLEACRHENDLLNRRMETMIIEMTDTKGRIRELEKLISGKGNNEQKD